MSRGIRINKLQIELKELTDKADALWCFITRDDLEGIVKNETYRFLLYEQHETMMAYQSILKRRIELEKEMLWMELHYGVK